MSAYSNKSHHYASPLAIGKDGCFTTWIPYIDVLSNGAIHVEVTSR